MNTNIVYIAVVIFVGIYLIGVLVFFMFRQYLKLREKELSTKNASLDDFRAHLERQLMELNYRFSSSETRWKELNHLVVAGQSEKQDVVHLTRIPPSTEFLRSHGIEPSKLGIRRDLIFVLTPFHEDLSDEFNAIVSVGRDVGFIVNRGDERVSAGEIFPQLLLQIVQSRIVIANISGRNPNVFYELGIAHALDKPVILLAHKNSEVPFDIRAKQIVFYNDNEELQHELRRMLSRVLAGEER